MPYRKEPIEPRIRFKLDLEDLEGDKITVYQGYHDDDCDEWRESLIALSQGLFDDEDLACQDCDTEGRSWQSAIDNTVVFNLNYLKDYAWRLNTPEMKKLIEDAILSGEFKSKFGLAPQIKETK